MYLITLVICIISILVYFIITIENSSSNEILEEVIRNEKFSIETHNITTEDGYFLTVHRIPGGPGSTPVYLQHGLLSSSADWFLTGKNKALPYILSDHGYDVWVGNIRGNHFSKKHKTFSTEDPKFWNFSWNEIGLYDVPAIVTYISQKTNSKMFYIGHSMGCTMFSVMASQKPNVAKNVKMMVGLAPATFEYHIKHPMIKLFSNYWAEIQSFFDFMGINQFLPRNWFFDLMANKISKIPVINQLMAKISMYLFEGSYPEPEENGSIPYFVKNFPSGTSKKNYIHWLQQMTINELQNFDYGKEKNLEIYGTPNPPKYDLSKVQVPVAIFSSEYDLVTTHEDAKTFYNRLPVKAGFYTIDNLSHADFLWREKAVKQIYHKILSIFEEYR